MNFKWLHLPALTSTATDTRFRFRLVVLLLVSGSLLLLVFLRGPIPQDLQYHQFADKASGAGIANVWNVLSNVPFFIIGLVGMIGVKQHDAIIGEAGVGQIARVFFIGLIATAIGSAYYHLAPTNSTLIWDRLPMTISFMAFFSFILAIHIHKRVGMASLWPLLGLGLISVVYWAYTESIGSGDLRLYVVIQFLPLVLIPLILLMFPAKSYRSSYIWLVIGIYIVAKVLELYDHQIYSLINIGGHTLKHVVASLAGIAFLKALVSARSVRQ